MMMPYRRTLASLATLSFALLGCDSTSPRAATLLSFTVQPPSAVVSTQSLGDVHVTLLNALGQVATATGYQVSISLSASDTAAHLAGTTSVSAVDGVATFSDLSVARAGSGFRLVARVTGLDSAMSQPFTVMVGPPAQLRFDSWGPSLMLPAGANIPAVVRVADAGGNVVTNATNSVTIGYTRTGPAGMTVADDGLFGPTTETAINGVAAFNALTLHKTGGYTLTAMSSGLTAATSDHLLIWASSMTRLVFVTQPSNGTANTALATFSVQQVDDYGNGLSLPPGPPYSVTLSLGNNPGGAALGGTLTVQGFGTLAMSFGSVTIDKPGTGYTLVATSGARTVTSAAFNIQ